MQEIINAIIMGVVEGLTEFLPVSSTGHLIIAGKLLGFSSPGHVFEIVIQLGSILAIWWLYRAKIFNVITTIHSNKQSQKFTIGIILAFIPTVILGVILHKHIKELFDSPLVVCASLVVGGVAILVIERLNHKSIYNNVDEIPAKTSFLLGLYQSLAMIPGVSRSGATIMGGLLLGLERKTAAEFSFFLAIPTMLAATAYDLYKNRDSLTFDNIEMLIIGFITAFITAQIVVKWLISYISGHNFSVFGYYRIIAGVIGYLLFM